MIWFLRLFPSFRRFMARVEALEQANAERNLVVMGGDGIPGLPEAAMSAPLPSRHSRRQIEALAAQAEYAGRIQQQTADPTGWGT